MTQDEEKDGPKLKIKSPVTNEEGKEQVLREPADTCHNQAAVVISRVAASLHSSCWLALFRWFCKRERGLPSMQARPLLRGLWWACSCR